MKLFERCSAPGGVQKESTLRREGQRCSMLEGVWSGAGECQGRTIGCHLGICGVEKRLTLHGRRSWPVFLERENASNTWDEGGPVPGLRRTASVPMTLDDHPTP
jgi:hypothetical protein